MANNNNLNRTQISKSSNYATELSVGPGAITTISDEITKIASELSLNEVQRKNNITTIENLQKQIDFLTNEIKKKLKRCWDNMFCENANTCTFTAPFKSNFSQVSIG